MYYYIFDIKKFAKRSQVESIKDCLGSLGISGEFTYPSAAQSVEELVDLGLSKQYSTIVAIGGDEIANNVANKLVGRKEAMGIIPLDVSGSLSQLIGSSNWKEACEILRYRKIQELKIGKTATQKGFLTHAELDIKSPIEVTLEFKDFIVQTKARDLLISNYHPEIKKLENDYLDILITSEQNPENGLIGKFSSMFKKKEENSLYQSLIRARSLRIFTKTQIPIVSNGSVIAKSPQLIESSDEDLRLITAKKS